MVKLNKDDLDLLISRFSYSNLAERYRVLEEYFDIEEGSVVIDGGAFHGDMMQYFSKKVGNEGRVYSFEPVPLNLEQLKKVKRNFNLNNVYILPVGLWNKTSREKFYPSSYSNAGSLLKDFRKVSEDYAYARTAALDDIVKNLHIEHVDYIWTNIEGAEVKFLEGARNTLLNNDCKICISTHLVNDDYTTTNDVIKILTDYEYKCERVKDHEMWIYAEK